MPIVRWNPWFDEGWDDFDKVFSDLPSVFGQTTKGFVPPIDVYQDKSNVTVETPLPGVNPENVEISVDNDILKISGKHEKKKEIEEKDYYKKEVKSGSFCRSIALPAHVVGERASADYSDGMLKITIPKRTKGAAKTIKVNVKKIKGKNK